MSGNWRTAWQQQDIVVFRNDVEVDRIRSSEIARVVLVHRGQGTSPGDLVHAVVVLEDDCVICPADTGFAGRVLFERQPFWQERACVYWVRQAQAPLPLKLRRGVWFLRSATAAYVRMPRADLGALMEGWALQGPQTWDQRKWHQIENSRPFGGADARLRA